MKKSKRVVVIGSGNVAEAMCYWLCETEYTLVQLFARNKLRASVIVEKIGCDFESDPLKIAEADIYIISVSDSSITEVANTINFGKSLVIHTAGSMSIDALPQHIENRGVLYPLQTFTIGRRLNYCQIPLFIEASNNHADKEIMSMAESMSNSVRHCDSTLRAELHLAAVFVCNFVNHLYCIGEKLMNESNLDFIILKPLIEETTQKMLANISPWTTQTGPASREDYATISKHIEMLKNKPELKDVYKLLTNSIIKNQNG